MKTRQNDSFHSPTEDSTKTVTERGRTRVVPRNLNRIHKKPNHLISYQTAVLAVLLSQGPPLPPSRSAWAIEVHDIGPNGQHTERMRASGAIATEATHGTNDKAHQDCSSSPHQTGSTASRRSEGPRERQAASSSVDGAAPSSSPCTTPPPLETSSRSARGRRGTGRRTGT